MRIDYEVRRRTLCVNAASAAGGGGAGGGGGGLRRLTGSYWD